MKTKECPFCGLSRTWTAGTPPFSLVGCAQCRAAFPPELWNRRAMPEEVRKLLDALELASATAAMLGEENTELDAQVKAVREYYGEAAP